MASARIASRSARPAGPARVRWDRVGRMAMLFVLFVLVYLYISPVRSLISAFHQAAGQRSEVTALTRTTNRLVAEQAALKSTTTLEVDARQQGMVKPGEKEFVIFGLPTN